jgi:hypothetical protein
LCADARKGEDPKASIIDVCASHLLGDDIVQEGRLLLVPFTQGTPCGELPDHSEGVKLMYRKRQADIVATVEQQFPKDAGKIKVCIP